MGALYSVMWYKATAGFQHKIADYLSFYPHLLLGFFAGLKRRTCCPTRRTGRFWPTVRAKVFRFKKNENTFFSRSRGLASLIKPPN